MKRTVSAIMLSLLVINTLTLAFNIQPVKASGTIYIRADGSIDPPTAPISTVDNVTYTLTANIYEEIVVERSNIVVDGNGYTLQGPGSGTGIHLQGINNVTIKNTNIENYEYGIMLYYSSNNSISGNNITANKQDGIRLNYSSNSSISGNSITANAWYGIYLWYSSYNSISGNNIKANNYAGVRLNSASGNYLINNSILSNFEKGIIFESSPNTGIIGNIVAYTDGDETAPWYQYSGAGITGGGSGGSLIENNTVHSNFGLGILVHDPTYIRNNTAHSNGGEGIKVGWTSGVLIEGNTVYNNSGMGAIGLDTVSNSIVRRNKVYNNTGVGILIYGPGSYYNLIEDNIVSGNTWGIGVGNPGYYNTIRRNTVSYNQYGIRIGNGYGNRVYHNNIINNTYQAEDTTPQIDYWDDGYPSGGNYWSDYNGTDFYSGPNQDLLGSDGIGDTPYVIDAYNRDRYPLMNPWTPTPPAPPVLTATVDVHPQTLNLRSRGRWITAYIELPEGYNVGDINVYTVLLNSTIQVDLDAPTQIGDYDKDGIIDLMVKFNRTAVSEFILSKGVMTGNVTLTITGRLNDGTPIQGSDTISVRMPGDINLFRHNICQSMYLCFSL